MEGIVWQAEVPCLAYVYIYIYIYVHILGTSGRHCVASWSTLPSICIYIYIYVHILGTNGRHCVASWSTLPNLYLGGIYPKPPKLEHIFVAVITFSPFLLCRYFWYKLVAYCVCTLRWYVKYLCRHLFLEDTFKKARVVPKNSTSQIGARII